tara:strand:+ start:463 stop:624 length:162 start_codon:yes stop_codon:yes gene_type:complete
MVEKVKKYFKNKYSDKFIKSVNKMKNDKQLELETKDSKKKKIDKLNNNYFKKK